MSRRHAEWGLTLCCAILCSTCNTLRYIDVCDPKSGKGRVGFYSVGDCVGSDLSVFRGHEWITFLGNRDDAAPNGQFFTSTQIDAIIEGNRHTDFPKELLVHFDNGPLDYIDALFAYHNDPDGQSEHFILRADNTHEEARDEALGKLRALTHEAVALWPDENARALATIGKATHGLQDSYSPAHTVRVPQPANGDVPWCFCKLKTFVPRIAGLDTDDIEFHDRLDDDRKPGHTSALDSIYEGTRECLDPNDPDTVLRCMKAEPLQAVVASRDYLRIVRELVLTSPDAATIDARLDAYFALHFSFCDARITLPEDAASKRKGMECDRPIP